MNKKIVAISNSIILGLCILLLSFVWFRHINLDIVVSVSLAIIVSGFSIYLNILGTYKKNRALGLKKADEIKFEEFRNFLTFSTSNEIQNLLCETLKDKIVENNSNTLKIKIEDEIYNVYNLTYTPMLCKDDIYAIFRTNYLDCTAPNIIVVIDIDDDAKKLLLSKNSNLEIIDAKKLFALCLAYNTLPKNTVCKVKENKFKYILRLSINPKNFKGYIFAAIVVALSSIFVRIKIYYLIWSSILLILALLSHYDILNAHYPSKTNVYDSLIKK